MSSPADDPLHTVVKAASPVPEPTADDAPATGTIVRAADQPAADPNCATARPAGEPSTDSSVVDNVNVTQLDGTHPVQSLPLPASDSVPGYEILAELGRGGMGVVYKARHVKLNRLVALKLTLGGTRSTRSYLIRFLAEAEAVAAIKHPNVVQVYDYGDANGRPFMALEFCPGGSLAGLLAKNRDSVRSAASVRDTAALVGQVARGVAAAHALGIVHRDLNPANVLLDEAGVPKVADFGLAKREDRGMTQVGDVVGTPAYMSPEQAQGQSKFVGPQADVWALGVMLYEALAGTELFTGTLQEVFAKVLHANPGAPSTVAPAVPRELDLICLKCLSREPHERYATAKELAEDIQRYLDGGAFQESRTDATPAPRVAERWWRGAAVGLACVLVVGVVIWMASRPRAQTTQVDSPTNPVSEPKGPGAVEPKPLVAPEKRFAVCPAGWVPVEAAGTHVIGDRHHHNKLTRTVAGEKLVAILVVPTRPVDPDAFYMLQNKVTNRVFAAMWERAEKSSIYKRIQSTNPDFIRGKWLDGAVDLEADEKKERYLGTEGVQAGVPVLGVTLPEAMLVASELGGRLPSSIQWKKAIGALGDDARDGPAGKGLVVPPELKGAAALEARRKQLMEREPKLALGLSKGPWPIERLTGDVSYCGIHQLVTNGQEWLGEDSEGRLHNVANIPAGVHIAIVVGYGSHEMNVATFADLQNFRQQEWTEVHSYFATGFRVVLKPQ